MAERYRFELPDGRVHESDAGLEAIRRAHPQAVITHRIELDAKGHYVRAVPYRGQAAEPPVDPPADSDAPTDATSNPDDPEDESHEDLSKRKVDELRAMATERGIDGAASMKKDELLEALTPAQDAPAS